jgi:hypothetical protein
VRGEVLPWPLKLSRLFVASVHWRDGCLEILASHILLRIHRGVFKQFRTSAYSNFAEKNSRNGSYCNKGHCSEENQR